MVLHLFPGTVKQKVERRKINLRKSKARAMLENPSQFGCRDDTRDVTEAYILRGLNQI